MYRDNTYTFSISLNKKIDFTIPIVFKPAYTKTSSFAPLSHKASENLRKASEDRLADKPCNAPATTKPTIVKSLPAKAVKTPTIMANKPIAPAIIKKPEVKEVPTETKPKIEHTKPTPAPAKKNAQICDNYKEVETLRRHAQLHAEVTKQWKPPYGVSPTCACDISFFVNAHGKIENLTIEKSSGVIMYDISARHALHSMTMPQWTHGKQLIINFK